MKVSGTFWIQSFQNVGRSFCIFIIVIIIIIIKTLDLHKGNSTVQLQRDLSNKFITSQTLLVPQLSKSYITWNGDASRQSIYT